MLRYFIHLTLSVIVTSHEVEIHKLMTPEEVQSVFKSDHNNVPDYEVAQAAHAVHEKSPEDFPHRILHLKSLKRDIKLYLEPTEGILAGKHTPIWKAQGDRSAPLGVKYTRVPKAKKEDCQFYQDRHNLAAFSSTHDDNGEVLFEGTIGDNLVVRALPKRLLKAFSKVFSRRKRSVFDDYFAFSNRTVTHPNLRKTYDYIVYENKEVNLDGIRVKLGTENLEETFSRQKRADEIQPPKTIYPEILVIVDYSLFLSLETISEVRRYVISFWNAVDLRFRIFDVPEIRLNIAGIIVATDPDGVPYVQNHRTPPIDGPLVDGDKALHHVAEYFFQELVDPKLNRFVIDKDFDVAITMTHLNLCNQDPADHDFDCTTLGYAFRGQACTVTNHEKMVKSVALVEDNGGYVGIVPAAHELGHLMGARHDGFEVKDKVTCYAAEGYIMGETLRFTDKSFRWSLCSKGDLQKFFHHRRASCLFNEPCRSRPVRRVLPGQIYSLDEQCDRIEGTKACNKNETVCIRLTCFRNTDGECVEVFASAAEGSDCGHKHYCINGKCIPKNTTEIWLEPPIPEESSESEEYESLEIIRD